MDPESARLWLAGMQDGRPCGLAVCLLFQPSSAPRCAGAGVFCLLLLASNNVGRDCLLYRKYKWIISVYLRFIV